MLHHLICHTYCEHTFTELPFMNYMWKIISISTAITANTYKHNTYICHHYSKCFTYIKPFNAHNCDYPHFTDKD